MSAKVSSPFWKSLDRLDRWLSAVESVILAMAGTAFFVASVVFLFQGEVFRSMVCWGLSIALDRATDRTG